MINFFNITALFESLQLWHRYKSTKMSKPYCVICSKGGQSLTSLTNATFNKCKIVLEIREQNNLAFSNVVLPNTLHENHMYHRSCYQRFTALPQKYRPKSTEKSTETFDTIPEPSTSSIPR